VEPVENLGDSGVGESGRFSDSRIDLAGEARPISQTLYRTAYSSSPPGNFKGRSGMGRSLAEGGRGDQRSPIAPDWSRHVRGRTVSGTATARTNQKYLKFFGQTFGGENPQ